MNKLIPNKYTLYFYILIVILIITTSILFILLIYYIIKTCIKQITNVKMLPLNIKNIILKGKVKKVPDGDGFSFYHIPLFNIKNNTEYNKKNWLPIRITGIDAPEMPSFGNKGQLGALESKLFLEDLLLNKKVRVKLLKRDRYGRLLCRVYLIKWFKYKDVGAYMLRKGFACVYTGSDAVYAGKLAYYRKLEKEAKRRKLGMWQYNQISPMEYKRLLWIKNIKK
ncbi:putative endonuclease LCL3 [Cucumispora dikerogammari]|nr:putative endonuclease LCL3 [Cucumispora dikerogammari]